MINFGSVSETVFSLARKISMQRFVPLVAGLIVCGCFSKVDPAVPFTATFRLVNGKTGAPMANSLLSVEVGGRYLPIPDTSRGNPNYTIGAKTDDNGMVMLASPGGVLGVHTFENGFFYGTDVVPDATYKEIKVEPLGATEPRPTSKNFAVLGAETATVAPGAELDFSADCARAIYPDGRVDLLSDEVLLVEPTMHFTKGMDPPAAGEQAKGFPDGRWKSTTRAPTAPGTYTYSLVISSEACVTSDRVSVTVVVAP